MNVIIAERVTKIRINELAFHRLMIQPRELILREERLQCKTWMWN